jgi:hypothetical protein
VPDEEDPGKTKVVAAFMAKARITVSSPDGQRSIVREGFGAARGFAKTVGEAMENAIKAAESDSLKRALVSLGDQFGLALYDRAQRNVAARGSRAAITAAGEQPLDVGFEQRRAPTSQRAIAAARPNGRRIDVGDLPV